MEWDRHAEAGTLWRSGQSCFKSKEIRLSSTRELTAFVLASQSAAGLSGVDTTLTLRSKGTERRIGRRELLHSFGPAIPMMKTADARTGDNFRARRRLLFYDGRFAVSFWRES
jgi:hypothetical protein